MSKSANSSHCAYKLDLSKAYDRVDWGFLEKITKKVWLLRAMDLLGDELYPVSSLLNQNKR
jgi:hypothetical protein